MAEAKDSSHARGVPWVATTIDNVAGAKAISDAITPIKLASQNAFPVQSNFWWDGKLDSAEETRIEVQLGRDSTLHSSGLGISSIHERILVFFQNRPYI